MSTRVTDAEVKRIIDTSIDTTPFIQAANLVITEKLGSEGLGSALLKEIERWFAAHLVAVRDPMVRQEKVGDATITYDRPTPGEGLESTIYGRQVLMLDTSGVLASLGKKKISLEALDYTNGGT